jgi:hypothetical protein
VVEHERATPIRWNVSKGRFDLLAGVQAVGLSRCGGHLAGVSEGALLICGATRSSPSIHQEHSFGDREHPWPHWLSRDVGRARSMHLKKRLLKQVVCARGVTREPREIRPQVRRQRIV